MTAPRQVLEGRTYLLTRRCAERRFFLRPSARTNQIFRYLLAVAAEKYGVQIHAACVLSNHFHLVVTDPQARLPAFGQYLDALVARAVNASHGRWEHFWSPASYSAVALDSAEDVVEKIAYTLANPVAAGLIRRARKWPGLWLGPDDVGRRQAVDRPEKFFRKRGKMPDQAWLEAVVPPQFESAEAFQEGVRAALRSHEDEAHRRVESFLGVAAVLAQRWDARPSSPEPRRALNPRLASQDKWKRIEALSRLQAFLGAYREARERLLAGLEDVMFPAGTYWLRVVHGVRCAPS